MSVSISKNDHFIERLKDKRERAIWTERVHYTSDKSCGIEISAGIAFPLEKTYVEKRPNRKEPEPPFMMTGGEKQAITQTQRAREGGRPPPMSCVD